MTLAPTNILRSTIRLRGGGWDACSTGALIEES